MSFGDLKISEATIQSTGVQSQPDTLTGSAPDNKKVFDALPTLIIQKLTSLIDMLGGTDAAAEMPIEPIDGMTAKTVQQALVEIRQALTAYIDKISGTGGAAAVGVSGISGIQAENTQAALAELKAMIDNLVIGALPSGSVSADMIADDAIIQLGALLAVATAAAYDPEGSYAVGDYCTHGGGLHKCNTAIPDGEVWNAEHWTAMTVAAELAEVHDLLAPLGGATTPQGALANLGAGVRPNLLDNPGLCVNQRGQDSYTGNGGEPVTFDRWQAGLHTTIAQNGGNIVVSASGGAGYILQRLENPILGKAIVFSVLTTLGLYECKGVVNSGGSITQATPFGAISVTHGARMYALIRLNDGQSITLPVQDGDVAKLEIGDTQTLAYQDDDGAWQLLPQPESDYATQLAKCQRYFRRFPANYVMGIAQNGNHVSFRYPCNPPMRTTPVLSMQNQSDLTDVIVNGAIPITPSGVVLSWNSNENVVGFFFNDVTDGTGFTCNRYIDASAEL